MGMAVQHARACAQRNHHVFIAFSTSSSLPRRFRACVCVCNINLKARMEFAKMEIKRGD